MDDRLDPPERAKMTAAYHAMALVEGGMSLGLGTGSTASWLVRMLGARRQLEGLDIRAVSTSETTEALARKVGIPTLTLDEAGWLDLTIDGADEIDPMLTLVKGGGGALLREKIVATASDRMVVIADPGKLVRRLGTFPLPVEVVRFGWEATRQLIARVLEKADIDDNRILRRVSGNTPFITDEGHFILDLELRRIGDVDALAQALLAVPGVVETGLFIDIANTVVVGASSGEARFLHSDGKTRMIDPIDDRRLNRFLRHIEQVAEEEG